LRPVPGEVWKKAAAAWALVIAATGLLPTQGVVHSVSGGRDDLLTSAGHFAAYAILAALLLASAGGSRTGGSRTGGPSSGSRRSAARPLAAAWLLAAALGALIEVVQGPLPYGDAQVWDVVVNGAGAALGLAVFSVAARARARG
jgi:VanZ family protein